MPKRFHLGWFVNFTAGAWGSTFSHGGSPWDGKFYVEFAQALERACFDYIMLEDTLMVSEAYRGTAEATLKYGLQVPKHDPVPLAAMIAAATSKLGVVARCRRWRGLRSSGAGLRDDRPHLGAALAGHRHQR